jgi:hypothetical protein
MGNSWFLSGEFWGLSGGEWKLHSHDEGRGGGTSWGVLPLGLSASPPPMYSGALTPSQVCSHTCPLVGIFHPLLLHLTDTVLRRSPAQFSPPPSPLCRSATGGSRGSTNSAANWRKGVEVVDVPYVWPSTGALPVCGAKFFATLRSGEYTLHHPRLFAGTFSCYRSSRVSARKTVTSYLLDSILVCCKS